MNWPHRNILEEDGAMNIITSRAKPFVAVAGGIAVLLTIVSLAPAGEARSRYRHAGPAAESTRIEIDSGSHEIRFYIEGKRVALVDSGGISH
jgi:hypothetical protein